MGILGVVLIINGLIAVGAAGYLIREVQRMRRIRALRRAPTVAIAEVSGPETRKIRGRVSAVSDPLIAPLSRRPCVYYRVEVSRWSSVRESLVVGDCCDFFVEDASGRALVVVDGISFETVADQFEDRGDGGPRRAALDDFLHTHDYTRFDHEGRERQLTFEEAVIEIGEDVAVSGRGVREPDSGYRRAFVGYRDVPSRLVISAPAWVWGAKRAPRFLSHTSLPPPMHS